jgi:hypothetical protein
MGGGGYSFEARTIRADALYERRTSAEIFTNRQINNAMSPHGLDVRESRDSEEHPESLAIILALDVTGSMGTIPHMLVKDGFPKIIEKIMQRGIQHPQVLFTGIGDHIYDDAPLQVGQFESSDELLDKWLTDIYLEGGGGGNLGESYLLAWDLAAKHTSIDCYEKRKQKGFLFTIGDEPTLNSLSSGELREIYASDEQGINARDLLEAARKTYNVFHIHVKETRAGSMQSTIYGWRELMGQDLLVVDSKDEIPNVIADTIINFTETNKESTAGKDPDLVEGESKDYFSDSEDILL